jgi:hypothetical protein
MEDGVEDERFDARVEVLRAQVEHHVQEEEGALFPKVRRACSGEELDDLGDRMKALAEQLLEGGSPSSKIPDQTDRPAHV